MSETTKEERYITVGFIGEADIDKEASPEDTLENLMDISEQCGYMTYKGMWTNYSKEIILETTEGTFFIKYCTDMEDKFKFQGVYVKKRIQ